MLKAAERESDAVAERTRAAEEAALSYASDEEPGIRRLKAGKGFRYLAEGRPLADGKTLERIRALAIPPAWSDVWIAPRADGHIQATGRDQRGRKQYRYHARWSACRDAVKYAGLVGFAEALPRIRRQVERDLAKKGLAREKVVAAVVWLLDNAMIRIGNPAYARDNQSFGLTTLRNRHVAVNGATIRFAFGGKSGKDWRLKVTDRRIARLVRQVQDLPGQHLFQSLDADGGRHPIGSDDVNAYIRAAGGEEFSSKYFRTWGGSVRAAERLAATPLPETKRAQALALNSIVDEVAKALGNTRSICRKCYIHPRLVSAWLEGRLEAELGPIRRATRSAKGLDREEAILLRWLKTATRGRRRGTKPSPAGCAL